MTKREFAVLAVRLLALYVVAASFATLWSVAWVMNFPTRAAPVWQQWALSLAPFVLHSSFGWFLWMFAVPLSLALTDTDSQDEAISSWEPRQLTRLGIALVGMLALLQGVHVVGQTLAQFGFAWGAAGSGRGVGLLLMLAVGALPITFGLILLLGSRFLSYWLAPRREPPVLGESHD